MIGTLPRRGAAVNLAILSSVFSILGWLAWQWLGWSPYLIPAQTWGGAFWQPLTWIWLTTGAFRLLLSAFLIWLLGAQLELLWGRPKFWRFVTLVPLLAGVLTTLLSLGWGLLGAGRYEGGGLLTTALWVALGLELGKRPLNFFGIPLTGFLFAALGVAFVALEAIFNSVAAVIPALWGVLLCFVWVHWRLPSKLQERYGSWRMKSRLHLRRKQLKLLAGGKRNTSKDSDNYLH